MDERKRRDFYTHGGSHTRAFSIGWEHPGATTLMQASWGRTHLNWNLPYNLVLSNQLAAAAPSVGWCLMSSPVFGQLFHYFNNHRVG